jgi:hypothetical protein
MLAAGKQPYVDPRVDQVLQACEEEHRGPAVKAMNLVNAQKSGSPTKDQPEGSA